MFMRDSEYQRIYGAEKIENPEKDHLIWEQVFLFPFFMVDLAKSRSLVASS